MISEDMNWCGIAQFTKSGQFGLHSGNRCVELWWVGYGDCVGHHLFYSMAVLGKNEFEEEDVLQWQQTALNLRSVEKVSEDCI